MVVAEQSGRLVEAWLPHWPSIRAVGPSLAALRDDLALAVMERFEKEAAPRLGAYQLPPHLGLRHVKIDTVAQDREKGLKLKLQGRLGALVEKWPADDFWIVTPTRLLEARFALRHLHELDEVFIQRMTAWCLERRIESLEPFHAPRRERLDLLEVDAYPPTILPRGQPKPPRRRKPNAPAKEEAPETPQEAEERRNRRRLTVRTLREVARNLAHAARDDVLERAFGREALVQQVVDELEGREGAAIVLLGPSGSGKTALVHEATRRLVARHAAAGTRRDVWRVDGNAIISGMMYVGQWEARTRELIQELVEINDVLYVDDLASLVYAGRTRSSETNVARFLEPHLARGELTVLAESTPERFERVREEAPTFAALFRVVHVPPLGAREALPVLLGVLRALEEERSGGLPPRFSPAGLELLLGLVERFAAHEALPGKAVRLLRRVVSGPGKRDERVRRFDVADVFEAMRRQTGLPDFILGNAPKRPREEIRRDLADMVAGQPEAVDALTDAVLAMQASLQDPGKPLATYLFVGPTGVGKTEAAKALARYLFGSADRLVRFDMSEMVSSGSIARFVGHPGAPDGELTTALRTQPFCVVLLDEIEKAHPRVFDALLQLLGEGRLTDAAGRTVDARQSVIVMTSNLGVREAAARTGFLRGPTAEAEAHYLSAVRSFFRPELFNRLDRVVPFRSLDKPALRRVVEHALADLLSRRGIRRGNVLVDVEPELLDLLVEQAFDPRYGARPLRRALEKRLTVPLAHHLVRRSSADLALVELFRRGDDMGLGVRLISDAASVPPERDPLDWTLPELLSILDGLKARVDALEASPEIEALRARQRGTDAHLDLLERLEEITEQLRGIEDTELSDLQYEEQEDPVSGRELRAYSNQRGYHHRGRGGLRPRPAYRDVPLRVNADVTLRRCRPQVVALRDRVEVLEHQVRASARKDEAFTVLLECVGEYSLDALQAAAGAFPAELARAQQLHDGRRTYFTLEGAGIRELIEPWCGLALMALSADGILRTAPVWIELIPDLPVGADALAARDARVAAAREARRLASDPPAPPPGIVVLRQSEPGAVPIHVATGRPVDSQVGIAACLLRARAGGEGQRG